ncbi:uncharacterized protein LOC124941438 [Impatiens glandulifera]|uniref:uncharacterized protein LOC124941438 n=1 Tax=Impatiens glandulifera TaxID=253017 RepID=UPI001FB165E0|nr:uncharacterized protein LOC124941438 [Impatiens glandulifera]
MAKEKLILICQFGGEFVKNEDGSLTYNGGNAEAVTVNGETLFDDFKLKLAEMFNLEYKSVSIKYFLPRNNRTLITLSSDKDLKRMLGYHTGSITANIYVTGKEGFDLIALNKNEKSGNGIEAVEAVNKDIQKGEVVETANGVVIPSASTAAASTSSALFDVAIQVSDVASRKATKKGGSKRARKVVTPNSKKTLIEVDVTASDSISSTSDDDDDDDGDDIALHGEDDDDDDDYYCRTNSSPFDGTLKIDMLSTPADSVKKRRRSSRLNSVKNSTSKDEELDQDNFDLTYTDDISFMKLVATWKDGITGINQEFKDINDFRDTLQKYAIAQRFGFRLKKNDVNRASGVCVVEGCSWKISASRIASSKTIKIRKFNDSHTCNGESWKSAHPAKRWLMKRIKEKLSDSPHSKPRAIASKILQDFGMEMKYSRDWRGIENAIQGSHSEAYNMLPRICEKITCENPGSIADLVIDDEKQFRSLFVSFRASVQGFLSGCRPLVFLESISLRSKYQESLLIATGLDGDESVFPIAFAIVDVESDLKWRWFLEQMKPSLLSASDGPILTFVFDRETGLKDIVNEVFINNAYCGYSMYHLLEGLNSCSKGPFHGEGRISLPVNFVAAAQSVRVAGFRKFTGQIKNVSSDVYDWVMQIEPECWTTSLFKGERFNHITEKISQSYDELMEEVQDFPITQKIDSLINMITYSTSTRKENSENWSTKLTPSKEEKLREEIFDSRGLKVLTSSDTMFEVHGEAKHVVNLEKCECTCLKWRTTGLPCSHAIAVFSCKGKNVYDYCSKFFMVDAFKAAYMETINPVLGINKMTKKKEEDGGDEEAVEVLPPPNSPVSSQPKMKEVKAPKVGARTMTCTKCKRIGHNKTSCKGEL